MKKETTKEKVNTEKKKTIRKLKNSDIKKNSKAKIINNIKKIKLEEKKITMALAMVVVVLIALVICFVYLAMSVEKIEGIKTGPLYVVFSENDEGMGDIINFTEEDGIISSDGVIAYTTSFKVTNYKGLSSWYGVYLDDYQDMIDYHECENNKFSEDEIYFSVDNSIPIKLSEVSYGGRYVLTEGIIGSNTSVTHTVKVWHMGYSEKHFHGKITVKFIR